MDKADRHKKRMQSRKSVVDLAVAKAQDERGVLLVLTGNGKGKSSSAFGMVARALGHDMKVAVVQFIKGAMSTGEEQFFSRFPEVEFHAMGAGFTWDTQDQSKDKATSEEGWAKALSFINDPAYELIILDELNIVIGLGLLPLETVLSALQNRPEHQHVVVTGRTAKQALQK